MIRKFFVILSFCLIATLSSTASAQTADVVSTREMSDINWMEFKEVIPSKINTVILPTGTLEPHGVINNGADIIAPVAIARKIAREVNAMIAPVVPYGITGSMDAYPGAFSISEAAYRAYMRDVLVGLARNGFRNIIIVNGHGGPQTAVLSQVAMEVGQDKRVRTLVVNWWSYAADVTLAVFGEDGGHAGWNETAFVQAIDPKLVDRKRYSDQLATPNPAPGTYSAYPAPSSIGLYKEGQGYVKFDQKKADEYFAKVTDKIAKLILDIRRKWDMAGL
ncbi:MAG TPA: creatininase family protein [Blastocatellia bacterium]|nr:creatininase family protein [Blastocatellia bacterium]